MTKNKLFMMLAMGCVAATISCDGGSSASAGDLSTNDCPIGMFRPVGLDACVFSAEDVIGTPLALSDDRCAAGAPAIPPTCVSDAGLRSYLATSMVCAPSYRFEPGACERGNNTGTAGGPVTGFGSAGAIGGDTGAAGAQQVGGSFGGDTTGAAGSEQQAGAFGGFDAAGAGGSTLGSAGATSN
jgi:hypothetical protein